MIITREQVFGLIFERLGSSAASGWYSSGLPVPPCIFYTKVYGFRVDGTVLLEWLKFNGIAL